MTNIAKNNYDGRLNPYLKILWKFALFVYIICNTAFASKSALMMLNSYALYLFVAVSALCILCSGIVKFNIFS